MTQRFNNLYKFALMGSFAITFMCTGCLNPSFVNQSVGGLYPTAPGNEPFLMVRVINDTQASLEVPIVYDVGTSPSFQYLIKSLTPQARESGLVLEWPVLRVALGNLVDPGIPNIIANFPDGSTSAIPFGHDPLVAEVDYERGDTIIFHITADSRTPSSMRVDIGKIEAAAQPDGGFRADPFFWANVILSAGGF